MAFSQSHRHHFARTWEDKWGAATQTPTQTTFSGFRRYLYLRPNPRTETPTPPIRRAAFQLSVKTFTASAVSEPDKGFIRVFWKEFICHDAVTLLASCVDEIKMKAECENRWSERVRKGPLRYTPGNMQSRNRARCSHCTSQVFELNVKAKVMKMCVVWNGSWM